MSAYTELRTLIVTAAMQDRANAVGNVLDPGIGGAQTFVVGASATGQLPATHYVCSTLYVPAVAAVLDQQDATDLHAALQHYAAQREREYNLTLEEAQQLRDAIIVTDRPLQDTLWRLEGDYEREGPADLMFTSEVEE